MNLTIEKGIPNKPVNDLIEVYRVANEMQGGDSVLCDNNDLATQLRSALGELNKNSSSADELKGSHTKFRVWCIAEEQLDELEKQGVRSIARRRRPQAAGAPVQAVKQ